MNEYYREQYIFGDLEAEIIGDFIVTDEFIGLVSGEKNDFYHSSVSKNDYSILRLLLENVGKSFTLEQMQKENRLNSKHHTSRKLFGFLNRSTVFEMYTEGFDPSRYGITPK